MPTQIGRQRLSRRMTSTSRNLPLGDIGGLYLNYEPRCRMLRACIEEDLKPYLERIQRKKALKTSPLPMLAELMIPRVEEKPEIMGREGKETESSSSIGWPLCAALCVFFMALGLCAGRAIYV